MGSMFSAGGGGDANGINKGVLRDVEERDDWSDSDSDQEMTDMPVYKH